MVPHGNSQVFQGQIDRSLVGGHDGTSIGIAIAAAPSCDETNLQIMKNFKIGNPSPHPMFTLTFKFEFPYITI